MDKDKQIKALRKAYRNLFDLVTKNGEPFMDYWVIKKKYCVKIEKIHSKLAKELGVK